MSDPIADTRKVAHSLLQYGALGAIVLAVIVAGFWLLHTFVPIWVTRFETDEKMKVDQTAAMRQIAGAMEAFRADIQNEREAITGAISVACARRR